MDARGMLMTGALVRTLYGAASQFAPQVIFNDRTGPPNPDARYFNALFGGRDFTVAGLTVAAVRAGREREALLVNVSCEVTDAIALAQEVRMRGKLDSTTIAGLAFNLAGWISWARVAKRL